MDRQAHEYAAAMAFAQQQQQQQAGIQQQQHFGFHQQPHQFPQQVHGLPFMPPHPSMQQIPYHRHLPPQQQLYPLHHHPLHQQPPPSYQPHLPPHLASPPFMHPFESPPPPAMPPSDPELHKRIDKLVEYAAKNGPEFEAMIREKQQDNPDYSFLFGGEGHNYYRYKLWMFTGPPGSAINPSFPSSSMPTMPPHNSFLNQPGLNTPPLGAVPGPPASLLASPPLHQPSYPPYFDQHQQPPYSQPFLGQSRADYDSTRGFKGLSGPLPSDVAAELNSVLSNLTGTKESIKGAKMWFMQRSPFAPALAEALRGRIFTLDDSERQLHIIFLANDILFDSLQRRLNPQDLDNEALAFKPVLGSMLSRIYNNPHNKEASQSRLEKILQFWASKEVYDQPTIASLESEMTGGPPSHSVSQKESVTGQQPSSLWQHPEKQNSVPVSADQQDPEKQFLAASLPSHFIPTASQPFPSNQLPAGIYPTVVPATFPGSLPISSTGQLIAQPPQVPERTPPPYPLFPPGLIPGMVRKMQIGSGVPYSPGPPSSFSFNFNFSPLSLFLLLLALSLHQSTSQSINLRLWILFSVGQPAKMNDADVSRQIQQMVQFIRQEAEEKANEISVSAEEEFNIEKLQLVEAEKRKIRQEYEKKEKQVDIRKKIEYSMQLNASRIKVLQAQDDLVNSMKEAAAKELLHVSHDHHAYKHLLKDLIVQSLLRLKEPSVLMRCRKDDHYFVESVLHSAMHEYAEKSNVHPPEIRVDQQVYLPPVSSHDNAHGPYCSGGVVLASRDGKIVCENTLDARLDVVFRKKLPEIRKRLFGQVII